jgi:hypothetical protein
MSDLDTEMNVIADMLISGHSIDFMAIRSPERLNEILKERGVDLGNQAYVNEAGEYCVVDNLDDIWSIVEQGPVSSGAGQGKPSNAENLLSDEQVKDVGFKRSFIRAHVSGKLAEYDEETAGNAVHAIISDDTHPYHEAAASYFAGKLDELEESLQNYVDIELKDYPEEYRQQFLNEETDNLQSSMRIYYDIVEDYRQAQQDAPDSSEALDVVMAGKEAILSQVSERQGVEVRPPPQPIQGTINLDKFNM